jgi:hypothetical protein
LPFVGLRVGRIWLDQGCALELHLSQPPADDAAVVRLLRLPFRLTDAAGRKHSLTPHDHGALVPLFTLIGSHVQQAAINAEGNLTLEFDSGAVLTANELEDAWEYEQPWQFGWRRDQG